tara:strand:+ start:1454 stop:1747 length:294 start_codon:yes stop_codon:yes gene_type:complete
MSTDNKSQTDWQKREVGALWKKESSTQKYFSGHVKVDDYGEEKMVRVVVFSNRNKSKDNQPDFRIYTVDDSRKKTSEDSTSSELTSEQATENVEEVL